VSGERVSPSSLRAWVGRPVNIVTTDGFRRAWIRDREVLYPDDAAWEARVTGIQIERVPRYEAAESYTEEARRQVPDLARLLIGALKGDPRSPVYSDPVSLSSEASVLEHLVELLGDDPELVFVIEPGGEDRLLLHFERAPVAPSSGGPA
jgi:hypothetical protein